MFHEVVRIRTFDSCTCAFFSATLSAREAASSVLACLALRALRSPCQRRALACAFPVQVHLHLASKHRSLLTIYSLLSITFYTLLAPRIGVHTHTSRSPFYLDTQHTLALMPQCCLTVCRLRLRAAVAFLGLGPLARNTALGPLTGTGIT